MKLLTKNGKLIERNGKLFTTDISRDKQIIPDSLNILFAVNTNENDLLGNMTNEAVGVTNNANRQRALAFGNNVLVAGDDKGNIYYSYDNGSAWAKAESLYDKNGELDKSTITGIAFGKGFFVACTYGNNIYKSLNGIVWTPVDTNVVNLGGVIYATGRFVFVAKQGNIVVSDDLTSFETINTGGLANFACVQWGKDRFFAGTGDKTYVTDTEYSTLEEIVANGKARAEDDYIYYSLDGINWSYVDSEVLSTGTYVKDSSKQVTKQNYWGGGCYGKGKHILGGRSRVYNGITYSIVYSEDDCKTWIPANCPNAMFVREVEYIDGKFFAVGYRGAVGEVWSSLNGIDWKVEITDLKRQWVLTNSDDYFISLGDNGLGTKFNFGISWVDTMPKLKDGEYIWQKAQLRLTDGSVIESEVEKLTNFSILLKKQENTSTKINLNTTNEAHLNSSKSLYLGSSTTGNLKEETTFVQTDDADGSTPALQKISVQMKDGNFYVRNRTNQAIVEIRNEATKSTTGNTTTTKVWDNDIRLQNVEKIKLGAEDQIDIGSGRVLELSGTEKVSLYSSTEVKLQAPEVYAEASDKVDLCYKKGFNKATKLKLNSEGANLESDNKVGLRYENENYGEGRVVLMADSDHGGCSELEIETGFIEAIAKHGMTLNGKPVATLDDIGASGGGASFVNVTWGELKARKETVSLFAGQQYRITDYVTTTTGDNTRSAGHQFDIIVTADSENTLNENARAIQHEGDTYFANCNLNAWEIKYCLDNDTSRFDWADEENGKGVIYFMRDERNVEAPYDFKNIQFKRYKVTSTTEYLSDFLYAYVTQGARGLTVDTNAFKWFYTFTDDATDGVLKDTSVNRDFYGRPTEIIIRRCHETEAGQDYMYLPNIVFNANYKYDASGNAKSADKDCGYITFGNECRNMTFFGYIYNLTFGNSCASNVLGHDNYNIIFGSDCIWNTLAKACSDITLETCCKNNTFGDSCYDIKLGMGCWYNEFGNDTMEISLGHWCSYNTFDYCDGIFLGNDCVENYFWQNTGSITFGDKCKNNRIGEGSNYITFGDRCRGNGINDFSRNIELEHNVEYVYISYNEDGDYTQNVKVCTGICGQSTTNRLYLRVDRDLTHQTTFVASGSKEVIVDET